MTDNEVIKALEEMADYPHYYEEGQILKSALDIINRLKDNERKYRAKVQTQRYEISCNQKNIERYKGVIKIIEKDIAKAKSEAVKDFAERLKENISDDCHIVSDEGEYVGYDCADVMHCIDNIVKEMVGDDNA